MIRRRFFRLSVAAGLLSAGTLLLAFPAAAAGGVSRGLSVCGNLLIPSLFPFLVLVDLILYTGTADAAGRFLFRPTRWLFGLPGSTAAGILLSFVGGYPAGAAAAAGLLREKRITKEEARRMMRFCVCGGPGFLIGAVGVGMTGQVRTGVLLFVSSLLAALLIGITGAPLNARKAVVAPAAPPPCRSFPEAVCDAVYDACRAMLTLCGFVLLFSAVSSLADATGVLTALPATLFACFTEVTSGCVAASRAGEFSLLLLGFTVGFGGLSVHCQVAAALRGTGVITLSFFSARLLQGMLTAGLTILLSRLFPISLSAFAPVAERTVRPFYGSVVLSVSLLLLCGIFLLSVVPEKKVDFFRKV